MRRGRIRFGILVGLYLWGGGAFAQASEKVSVPPIPEYDKDKTGAVDTTMVVSGEEFAPEAIQYDLGQRYVALHDSANVVSRPIPEGLERFRSDPNYQYDRIETGGPSLWDLFWRWVDDALFRPVRENTSATFWSWFWLLAGIFVVAFVISKALSSDSAWFFRKKDEPVEIQSLELLDAEDIEAIDLDAMLEAALHEHRYRDAARFQYLRALQTLVEQGVIDWDKHKTNREYLAEVRSAGRPILNAPFADITRLFEWIWYGEFPVDEQRFALVRARFDTFSDALSGVGR